MSTDSHANGEISTTDAVGTDELSRLLTGHLEATVGEPGTEDFHEVYVVPDPDPESGVHLVMVLSTTGELFHAATFDVNELAATAPAAMVER